jgi:hypothetical protein
MKAVLRKLTEARPGLAKLESLGTSPEGREVLCLTVTDFTRGRAEDKPAYLIHGNIHAAELSGTHAALYTARQLLADYPRTTQLLERVAFHIVPRLNPDGAEFAVKTCGTIRSRHDRSRLVPNTLVQKDMDGDGLILEMRQEHPDGDRARDPKDERLLIRRKVDSKPPFYKIYPEGEILDWDGSDAIEVEGRSVDWNRQWSYDWKPEPEQAGSGDFPYSEPEMHALSQFIHAHPNIFGILGYHTGWAAFLRPPSLGRDEDIDEQDLLRMEAFGRESHRRTGLPTTSVVRYCQDNQRHRSLYGHFPMTGYQHLGLFVFEFELGTIMDSAGLGFEDYRQRADNEELEEAERSLMRWWDRSGRKPPFFLPWRSFDHPQLGPVEIGGRSLRDWANMTMTDLKKRCAGTYAFTLHHAEQHPYVCLEEMDVSAFGADIYRLRGRVANRGALPTHVTNRGAKLARLRPVRVECHPGKGVEVLSQKAHHNLGHLAGPSGSRALEWFVRGRHGSHCEIRVQGGTGGNLQRIITLP